jgi:hypothetical protein
MLILPALVTDGDTTDVRVAQQLTFAPGTIVAMDRSDLGHALYPRWTITRLITHPPTILLYEVGAGAPSYSSLRAHG